MEGLDSWLTTGRVPRSFRVLLQQDRGVPHPNCPDSFIDSHWDKGVSEGSLSLKDCLRLVLENLVWVPWWVSRARKLGV